MMFDKLYQQAYNIANQISSKIVSKINRQVMRTQGGSWHKSRRLTAGEMTLAQSVFGTDLELSHIQLQTAWWVLKNYAVSPNGNIYFNRQDWVADFSTQSLAKQSWLIHELTHVWQLQKGISVVRGALFDRRYAYQLQQQKSFYDYGIEQQARIVQDYFLRREQGKDCQAWQACIPFLDSP